MNIEHKTTERGFSVLEFTDRYDVACSLQKSSLATEDAIWFGCNDANPRQLVPGQGWQPIALPEGHVADTRMHLTREQVAELLPYLQAFVNTGEVAAPAALQAQTAPVNVPEWFKLVDERELLKIKHALESCDAGDYSTGSVIHPSYDEKAVEDALNSVTVMLSAAPSAPIAAPSEDAKRLDWLEAQGDPNLSWLARHSVTGRGYRLHQSTHAGFATPREAIDAAIAATEQQKESKGGETA